MVGVRKKRKTVKQDPVEEQAEVEEAKEVQEHPDGGSNVDPDQTLEEQDVAPDEQKENEDDHVENENDEAKVQQVGRKKETKKIPAIHVGSEFAGDTRLLLAAREGTRSIERMSKEWVVRYTKDRAEACAEAATFLLQACGVITMSLSASDMEQYGSDELKKRVEECVKDAGLENILGGRGGKHFKRDYQELWDKIIRELGKAGTFDMFVVEKLVDLTIALSTSAVREVRRIATITVGQISTSLLFLAAQMHDVRDKALDQANMATEKKKGKQAEAFKVQADKASSFLQETLNFVDSIFQSVFTTRFRDIDVEIRSVIVQNLGSWMVLYPTVFLSSTYLKYLAWALSDKDALVRCSAITSIRSIYQDEKNALQLKDFTNRFVDRMEELMLDKDDYVAVAGTELVTLLVHGNHIGSDRCRSVFDLLSDPSERLRSAAAELASGMIKRLGKEAMTKAGNVSILKKKNGRGGQNKSFSNDEYELSGVLSILKSLSEGYQNASLPEQIVFFVISSLYEKLGCLSNWDLMMDWLQRDVPSHVFGESSVLDLGMTLLCAIRASQNLPSSRSQQTKERKSAQVKAKQEITLLLQKDLQSLLLKFQSDSSMVSLIARMIPFMKLDLFSLKRQEPIFTKILDKVRDVMFRHTEHSCVLSCANALSWCMVEGKSNTRDLARAAFAKAEAEASSELQKTIELLQRLGEDDLTSLTREYLESNGTEESETLFTVKRSMVHVSCLVESHPSSFHIGCELQQHLNMLLSLASEGWHLPAKIIFDAERSLLLILLSEVSGVDANEDNPEKISSIKDGVSDLFGSIHVMIDAAKSHGWHDIAALSAAVMSDLFVLFNLESLPEHLKDLAYSPLDEDVDVFWNGIEQAICTTSLLDSLDVSDGQLAPSALDMAIRVASLDGMRQYKQLGAKILSYWEHPSLSSEASNKFKDLVKKLRQIDSHSLPDLYLNAMRISYNRYCDEALHFPVEEKDAMCEKAIEPFLLLSHKIASSQASLNAPLSTLSYISEKAALWALEETPRNLEFLQGGSYFVVKVKGADAKSILETLESAGKAAGAPPDTGDDMGDWELYYEYCDVLKMQTQKQGNKGVLKRSTPKETPQKTRRISFAVDEDFEANVDVNSSDRRRSSRFETAMSPNYQETLTDDVDIMDKDVVSQISH